MQKILTIFLFLFGTFFASGQTGNNNRIAKRQVTTTQTEKSKESEVTTPLPITDEEYAVFMTILGKEAADFVVSKEIEGGEVSETVIENLMRTFEGLSLETAQDYALKSKETVLIEKKFPTKKKYQVITRKEIEKFFNWKLDWKGFYKQYPNSGGIYSFSRVGFNKDGTQAYLSAGLSCGELCGQGKQYFLQKKDGEWIVVKEQGTWIS
jgi:hypothetical protein